MLNQLLGGRYQVIQALGEGGLAKTYIAEDHHRPSHPKCTVKFLKTASKDSKFLTTSRRLFDKEAEILEKLGKHNQIPRLLAHFEENKEFYIIEEFIEGYTLSTELPPGNRWSENKVISMLQDVLQILEFVHNYRVIHRDIKPNNLIRRQKDGRLVLIDFGAVKEVGNPRILSSPPSTTKTISIGTQGYMPPEQVRGKPRLNSDIYALGMIGIQALTGIAPIYLEEDADGEVIWQNQAKVSYQLAAILTTMVRYNFKDRYQSANEVLEALQSLIYNHKLTQPPQTATKIALKSDRSIPEIAGKTELQATKMSLGKEQLSSKVVTQPTVIETKIALKSKKSTPEVAAEPELQKTKMSLGKEQLISKVVTQPTAIETKISLKTKKSTPEATTKQEKKISLVYLVILLTALKNIDFSYTPIFAIPKKSRLGIGFGVASILVCIFAGYRYINYRQSYLQAQETLGQIEKLEEKKQYSECLQQAQIFPQDYSNLNLKLETLLLECRQGEAKKQLSEAKNLAEQNKFQDAIAIATQIPKDLNVYTEAQPLISKWSEKIFQIASNKYQEGKLEEAKAIAGAISADIPLTQEVGETIQQWDEEWQQNENYLQVAQKKLDERNWRDAIKEAQKVSKTDYWQKQSEQIIQKAEAERKERERQAAIQAEQERQRQAAIQAEKERQRQAAIKKEQQRKAPIEAESGKTSRTPRPSQGLEWQNRLK